LTPNTLNTLSFKSASELRQLLHARKISSVELTNYFLDRLEKLGPHYNALAESTHSLALAQATLADKLLPKSTPDVLATKDIPTRWGAPPFRNQVFNYDATVIQRLQQAGAILIGKLAMIEFAGGGTYAFANASLDGPGINPWNNKYWSGGSSSGSAIAVATGLVPLALGSETWGSIIMPATCCGITGLRPTWGLVSRYGAMELARAMDKIGPMAHSVEDCGWFLQAVAGQDPLDESTLGSAFKFEAKITQEKLRIAILPSEFSGSPETEKVFLTALTALSEAGITMTQIDFPEYPYQELTSTILGYEVAAAHKEFIASKDFEQLLDAHQKKDLKQYLHIPEAKYLWALQQRGEILEQLSDILGQFDAFITPTLLNEAVKLNTNLLKQTSRNSIDYSTLGSLFGLPALTLPMGFGQFGLPLGISIIGKPFEENVLLQIGLRFQRETKWHQLHPDV
jgi:aspartyl-tRNA(Asn)/glutamyl-tRNA(Gln) amidotransferase subunit A